jgi:hypothetical protein
MFPPVLVSRLGMRKSTNKDTNKMLVSDGIAWGGVRQQKTRYANKHAGSELR